MLCIYHHIKKFLMWVIYKFMLPGPDIGTGATALSRQRTWLQGDILDYLLLMGEGQ